MTWDRGNGNVGINNSSPGYQLDVSGDINFTGNLRNNGAIFSGGTSYPILSDTTNDRLYVGGKHHN